MSLLPTNSTVLERQLETITQRSTDLPVHIRENWNPDTCPVELLPWLAWALSVDYWAHSWSETIKRQAITQSLTMHRYKGTVYSIQTALNVLGINVEVVEPGVQTLAPFSFYLLASLNRNRHIVFNQQRYQQIKQLVDQVKPARCRYLFRVHIPFKYTLNNFVVVSATVICAKPMRCQTHSLDSYMTLRFATCSNALVHHQVSWYSLR